METQWDFILEETDSHYYCNLCGCDISGDENVQDHYEGKQHTESLKLYGKHISGNEDNQYYCQLCDCTIFLYTQVRNHVTGRKHTKLLNEEESGWKTLSNIIAMISIIATIVSFLFLASAHILKAILSCIIVFFRIVTYVFKEIARNPLGPLGG